ncbi:hypothetical protein, partial [Variovorax sp. 22077]|uniref:hypothetical protein n=1 Tax=Variovorax sp. 22077 TaxID=3453867 RepID=UPI003F840DEE
RVGQYSMEIAGQDCMEINTPLTIARELHEFSLFVTRLRDFFNNGGAFRERCDTETEKRV